MKPVEQMTDEELDSLLAQEAGAQEKSPASVQDMDFSSLSDEELDNLIVEETLAQQPVEPQGREGQAFAQGFGNAATFGYLPQIQAATEPLIQGAMSLFGDNTDEQLKAQGFEIQEQAPESYVQRRDKYIQEGQQLAEENPYSSIAGNVAGAVTSGIATGGGLNSLLGTSGKALTMGKRFKQAAGTGGVIGAIRNPGDTEGEVNLVQFEDRAKNAVKDAATGAIIQGGLEGVKAGATAVKNAGNNIMTWSQMKALKGSGAMLKDFRKAVGNKKAKELGQSVIDNKLMEVGDDVADIAKKSESALKESGQKIGAIYDKADDVASISSGDIKNLNNDFLEEASKRLEGKVGGKEVAQKLENVLEVLRENPNPTFGQLRKLRASIDDQINYSKVTNDLPEYQSELLQLRNKVQDLVKDKIGKVNPGLSKELAKENKNFSKIAEIAKISKDKMAREESNAAFGLRERISGGAGAVVGSLIGTSMGGPVGTAVGAAAGTALGTISTKVARQYGTPFVAMTANKVAKALQNNQNAIGKFSAPLIKSANNPKEFVAAINLMMKDPEFKKQVNQLNGVEEYPVYRGPAKR
jgi:hypothetical protein